MLCSEMTTPRNPSKHDIGQRIKARREYLGLSKKEMADLLGIGDRGYDHKEAGRREIASTELAIIAQRLGVSTDYLIGEEDEAELNQHEIVRFFEGLPPPIQQAELEHMRALHAAHVNSARPRVIGERAAQKAPPALSESDSDNSE